MTNEYELNCMSHHSLIAFDVEQDPADVSADAGPEAALVKWFNFAPKLCNNDFISY